MHFVPHPARRRSQRRRSTLIRLSSPSLLLCIFATFLAAGCDESFSPIEPSELQFSVFGFLDASADTQWIRVMPIRPLVLTSSGPLGATVTLENLGTGRIVELRDSLFRFSPPNPDVGSDGVYLHNFWTTERIEPGATYRFSARREGEPPSEAVVEIPPDYETAVWLGPPNSAVSDLVRLVGLRHLALVIGLTYYHDGCGSGVQRTSFDTDSPDADGDALMVPIDRRLRSRAGCGVQVVEKRELLVVGSGEAWPSPGEYSTSGLAVPDGPSNISNSIGFLGGVLTKVLPYEECRILIVGRPGQQTDYCRLRYDESSVTLRGTVRDVLCSGDGVAGAAIELLEINPDPSADRKLRSTSSRRSGEFEIGALEAGRRYALGVRAQSDQYDEYADTLEFTPGEQATHDVGLRRFECPS